ncbi:MAG: lysylphosphatidylglycerol synthase domain-containing protein [Candidatus Methanomethylicaceae archaeon]
MGETQGIGIHMQLWQNSSEGPRVSNFTECWRILKENIRRRWKVVQFLFAVFIFFIIRERLNFYWKNLLYYEWRLDYQCFFASMLLASVTLLSLAVWWVLSLRLLREHIEWKQGVKIWAWSQLAKYLPGSIWNYVGRLYACERAGLPKRSTMISLAVEALLRIQSGIIIFLISLPFWPIEKWFKPVPVVAIGVLLVSLLILNPYSIREAIKFRSRTLLVPHDDFVSLKYGHIIGLLGGHILTVVGIGGAFYLMVRSIYYVPVNAILPITGMLSVSVIVGFLNPLTPQGLGTREALLIVLLSYYLPVPVTAMVALLSRLWLMASEVLGVLIVTTIFYIRIPVSSR